MRIRYLQCALAFASFLLAGIEVDSAHAGALNCQRTITQQYLKYATQTMNALRQCENKVTKGQFPVGTDCQTEPTVVARLTVSQKHLHNTINARCGGGNHTCNASDTGSHTDETLASIGWDIGACPGFEGTGCTNTITDCNDIVDCISCIATAAESQALTLYDGAFNLPAAAPALAKCQLEIIHASVGFFKGKLSALDTCERKVLSGNLAGPCPDPETVQRIDKLALSVRTHICKVCGGADRQCGGDADLSTTDIGFTSTCPNVTIPGGAVCGGAIATVDDIATCVGCVTEFKVDCLDALSVPALRTYPPECNVAP
jgi:hypothetical protein